MWTYDQMLKAELDLLVAQGLTEGKDASQFSQIGTDSVRPDAPNQASDGDDDPDSDFPWFDVLIGGGGLGLAYTLYKAWKRRRARENGDRGFNGDNLKVEVSTITNPKAMRIDPDLIEFLKAFPQIGASPDAIPLGLLAVGPETPVDIGPMAQAVEDVKKKNQEKFDKHRAKVAADPNNPMNLMVQVDLSNASTITAYRDPRQVKMFTNAGLWSLPPNSPLFDIPMDLTAAEVEVLNRTAAAVTPAIRVDLSKDGFTANLNDFINLKSLETLGDVKAIPWMEKGALATNPIPRAYWHMLSEADRPFFTPVNVAPMYDVLMESAKTTAAGKLELAKKISADMVDYIVNPATPVATIAPRILELVKQANPTFTEAETGVTAAHVGSIIYALKEISRPQAMLSALIINLNNAEASADVVNATLPYIMLERSTERLPNPRSIRQATFDMDAPLANALWYAEILSHSAMGTPDKAAAVTAEWIKALAKANTINIPDKGALSKDAVNQLKALMKPERWTNTTGLYGAVKKRGKIAFEGLFHWPDDSKNFAFDRLLAESTIQSFIRGSDKAQIRLNAVLTEDAVDELLKLRVSGSNAAKFEIWTPKGSGRRDTFIYLMPEALAQLEMRAAESNESVRSLSNADLFDRLLKTDLYDEQIVARDRAKYAEYAAKREQRNAELLRQKRADREKEERARRERENKMRNSGKLLK